MNASFEEKSVWIQLVSMLVVLGSYFVIAGIMVVRGASELSVFVPVFLVAIVLMVVVLAFGHIVAAIASRPEARDERDRLISWRAESNASWVVAAGVLLAIVGLILSVDSVWIAHFLLLSLFASEVLKYVRQLAYYRRGM